MQEQKNNNNTLIAASILIAGFLIAGAVIFTQNSDGGSSRTNSSTALLSTYNKIIRSSNLKFAAIQPRSDTEDVSLIRQPDETDHIRGGDLNSPVIIVEYSDIECPFCASLHENLKQVVEMYDGKVAWVYRHLPLVSLHKNAIIEAHATECAAELGGNEAFWAYTDLIYQTTPSNDDLDLAELPVMAEMVGLNVKDFNKCMESEKHMARIERDYREAIDSTGGRVGTPHNIVFAPNGERYVVSGAQPVQNWTMMIDELLSESESVKTE